MRYDLNPYDLPEEVWDNLKKLNNDQLIEVLSMLYSKADENTQLRAGIIIENMVRENSVETLEESDSASIKDEIEARLEQWRSMDEDERILETEINEEYDDWYAPDEPSFLTVNSARISNTIKQLLLDAQTAAKNGWWDLSEALLEAVFEDTIEVTGDASGCMDALDLLEESVWYDSLPQNAADFIIRQAVLDTGLAVHEKVSRILKTAQTAGMRPDMLHKLVKTDQNLVSDPDFLNQWLVQIMESSSVSEKDKAESFMQAMGFYDGRVNTEELLWKYAPESPDLYLEFFKLQKPQWELPKQIDYLNRTLKYPGLSDSQKSLLLDELLSALGKDGQIVSAVEAGLQAFDLNPAFFRFKNLVLLAPEDDYLKRFSDGWESCMRDSAKLISALEGKPGALIKEIKEGNHFDDRMTITILLGILCRGKMENAALRELVSRFLIGNFSFRLFTIKNSASSASLSDFEVLFKRAFGRINWNQNQADRILQMIRDDVYDYTCRILSSQARDEYFRCTQLIGALAYTMKQWNEPNAVYDLTRLFDPELRRFRRFKAEFQQWVR